MNISHITCSGLREETSYKNVFELLQLSEKVELAVNAYPSVMESGTRGNEWFSYLLEASSNLKKPLNLAVHVDYEWGNKFCNGLIDADLLDWFYMLNKKSGDPVIKRWQINFNGNPRDFSIYKIAKIISNYHDREFIFPYNDKLKKEISKLNATGVKFSLIYDTQHSYNNPQQRWLPPVFDNHKQGYSGGLSGENVSFNLDRISEQVPKNSEIWIQAYKNLINQEINEFDFARAKTFINNVLKWSKDNHVK
ncbi:MAG: hypothetical protein JW974_03540 [Alphaproteobacteria bacterium]|nr:hypothetical protein [Alphaproteobacteria bacterium]MBN2675312.1 hypothetical protein [Alphaproteobacteria bacterium]